MNSKSHIVKLVVITICVNLHLLCNSQTVEDLKHYFQPNYGEWKLSDEFQIFNPDNLFDYINGAADTYIDFDFRELLVARYQETEDKYIKVEIYQHKALPQAFGIYASERPTKGKFEKIGTQGYKENGLVNFFIDRYYIKILCHEVNDKINEIMANIAMNLSEKLSNNPDFPEILQYFPSENKIPNSESFTNNNFLGYEFLRNAYLTSYAFDDNNFKLFIITCLSDSETINTVQQYTVKLKMNFNIKDEGQLVLKDPYNGKISIAWKGKYIWGILHEQNSKLNKDYLNLFKEQLIKYKVI